MARSAPRTKGRAPGWGKEAVLRELEAGYGISEICAKYAAEAKPQSLRTEVQEWQFEDPEFAEAVTRIVGAEAQRPRGDVSKELIPGNEDWRMAFCRRLYETGSRLRATEATPFVYATIYERLNEDGPSYDKQFAEMVHHTQMQLCAEVEGEIYSAVRNPDLQAKDRAWVGFKILERQDPKRWGKQVEMIHSGKIQHEAIPAQLPREQRLAALAGEQTQFMLAASNQRTSVPAEDVVDAVVVQPERVQS